MKKPERIPLAFITLSTLLCMSLGVWQLARLEWKNNLITQMEDAAKQPALGTLPTNDSEIATLTFRNAALTGTYDTAHLLRFIGQKSSGYVWYAPLKLEDSDRIVLVAMDWLPAKEEPKLSGEVQTVSGILRDPRKKRMFSPNNYPEKNLWFTEDLSQIAAFTELKLAPLVLDTQGKPNFRNDHLGYAITWFMLAAAGLIMFVIYHRKPV